MLIQAPITPPRSTTVKGTKYLIAENSLLCLQLYAVATVLGGGHVFLPTNATAKQDGLEVDAQMVRK